MYNVYFDTLLHIKKSFFTWKSVLCNRLQGTLPTDNLLLLMFVGDVLSEVLRRRHSGTINMTYIVQGEVHTYWPIIIVHTHARLPQNYHQHQFRQSNISRHHLRAKSLASSFSKHILLSLLFFVIHLHAPHFATIYCVTDFVQLLPSTPGYVSTNFGLFIYKQ